MAGSVGSEESPHLACQDVRVGFLDAHGAGSVPCTVRLQGMPEV